ncbi:cytidylyltransferase domain-containing protein [Dongia deserti]|uniref:cytidylyltransferase domain-containing protein n=1 Tax=Dongia deserti TaxID=2268030 RepID=UPI000E654423|nr:glycosyltransferase family protein [Dongia deserti]
MKVLAILQARMTSTRLPGKVMRPILNQPMLLRQIERIRRARTLSHLIVATSDTPMDDPLAEVCRNASIDVYRGSLDDVLRRYVEAATPFMPDHIVRLTGDCPLTDPAVIDRVVTTHLACEADYTCNVSPPTYPDGLDVEAVKAGALNTAHEEATNPAEREHVTLFVRRRPDRFNIKNVANENGDVSHLRWTVDEPADFELIEAIYGALYPSNPAFTTADVISWLHENPAWRDHNLHHKRNEGLAKTLAKEASLR